MIDKGAAPRIGRRRFIGSAALTGLAGAALGATSAPDAGPAPVFADIPDYGATARDVVRWIRAAEIDKSGVWRPEPDQPEIAATVSLPNGFYTGSAGLVLFFIELADATGDKSYLADARRGGDYLVRSWRETAAGPSQLPGAQLGLYTGLAGTLFALAMLWKATGDTAFRDAARDGVDVLLKAAEPRGKGVAWIGWPGLTGDGGVVLGLLALDDLLGNAVDGRALRSAAIGAGDRIVEQGISDPRGGLRWQGMPASVLGEPEGTYWPNFQLGTAGTAYALARLGTVTGESGSSRRPRLGRCIFSA